jgi:hypothetical protein
MTIASAKSKRKKFRKKRFKKLDTIFFTMKFWLDDDRLLLKNGYLYWEISKAKFRTSMQHLLTVWSTSENLF